MAQVARVRVAYAGAKAYLTPDKNLQFAEIDPMFDGTAFFMNCQNKYDNMEIPKRDADRLGYGNMVHWSYVTNATFPEGFAYAYPSTCVQELFTKLNNGILSFLEDKLAGQDSTGVYKRLVD